MSVRLFHADHVLPGDGPSIADGAVVVAARGHELPEGSVVDVGRATEVVPRHSGADVVRAKGVVFPGLVNAHTHLELSSMRGRVPGGRGFVAWVTGLIGTRREMAPEEDAEGVALAMDELVQSATVAVGDVTNTLAAVTSLARRGIGGAVFHEVFGHDRASVLRRVEGLRVEREERVSQWPTSDLTYAPAPHTLYTTHPDAVRALLDGARARGVKTSLHMAEHASERRAIEHDDGPVPEWLLGMTKHRPAFPKKPLFDYADELGALSPDVLLVHLTDARLEELVRVREKGAPVVLCPRSNLTIESRLPPLLAVREAGIAPALGTDSLASSPSLDVLGEAKALADRFPSVPAWELFQMASWNGARALGRADLGRFAKGTRPGVFVVDASIQGDPAAFMLANLRLPRRQLASRFSESQG
ncbi:Adenosine deaminase [Labilithrix luteola]|uniref:Adenosine deaminase n=1 Tax=Labilithrix luteola TaxID=1391654 RepID=A0A0K1Q296_9BACT|nr:amidohydrolase family protein [Labilithrix luteola]AKU99893.1 Adenosine deaminase [Labilithrix luteola]